MCKIEFSLLNPKIVVGGVVAAFAIIIGFIGISGSTIIDDTSGGNIISPSDAPRQALPIEVQLQDISILEANEKTATIQIEFEVTNPNFKAVILQVINYEILESGTRLAISQIGERPAGMLESSNYFTILSGQPTILRDTITLQNSGNTPEIWDALMNNSPQWKIKGEASFNLSSITAGGENIIAFELP